MKDLNNDEIRRRNTIWQTIPDTLRLNQGKRQRKKQSK